MISQPERWRSLARQVLRQALEKFEAGDKLRLVHEFVRLVRLVDRTGAADHRGDPGGGEQPALGAERDLDPPREGGGNAAERPRVNSRAKGDKGADAPIC